MNNVVVKNILSLFGIQGMNYLIPLITLPYLVRVLGVESYGELGFTIAFIQYFSLLTEFGFNLSITRKISLNRESKDVVSKIFWTVMSCKFLLFIFGLLVLLISLYFSPMLADLKWVMFSYYIGILGYLIFPVWLFQGLERMGWIAVCNITAKLTSVPLTFILVSGPNDTYLAALVLSVSSILAGIISLIYVYKEKWIKWQTPSFKDIINEYKEGWYIFISIASTSMYSSGVTVILGFMTNPMIVGYYVAADKFRQVAQGLINPVSQAIYPRMVAMITKDLSSAIQWLRKLLLLQGAATFLLSLTLFLLSDILIHVVYGHQYTGSVIVLKWLAWMPFVIGVGNVFGVQTLLALGYKKEFGKNHFCCGMIGLVLLVPCVYLLQAQGAAISALAGELMVTLSMLVMVVRKDIPLLSSNKQRQPSKDML